MKTSVVSLAHEGAFTLATFSGYGWNLGARLP